MQSKDVPTIIVKVQDKRIPFAPIPINHLYIIGIPGQIHNLPVLITRAIIERLVKEITIRINTRMDLHIVS